jgi:hypothetical protein
VSSLKGFIPSLARIVGVSADVLYERQRALVRAGLLAQAEGRGPGSGVRATARSVALLLIAVLASDTLADSAERAKAIAAAKTLNLEKRGRGKRRPADALSRPGSSFADALTAMLTVKGLAEEIEEVVVLRAESRALIRHALDNGQMWEADFWPPGTRRLGPTPAFSTSATLSGEALSEIARDVQAIISPDVQEDAQ